MDGLAARIIGSDNMKRYLSVLLSFALMFLLAGCQGNTGDPDFRDEATYDAQEGFAESLKSDYLSFRKKYPEMKNDVCFYVNAQNKMPEGREVKYCLTKAFGSGWREAGTLKITTNGVNVSDEQMIFSLYGKHFPVKTVTEMTDYETIDLLRDKVGQVQTYAELGNFCAFTVNQYAKRPEYIDTVFFGTTDTVRSVDISLGEFSQPPDRSIQITNKYINYFAYEYEDITNSSIIIAQIPRDGGEVITRKILCSDLGLPPLFNGNFCENIFIDGDYLFFLSDYLLSTEPEYVSEFYITAYNLKTYEFNVYKTQDFKGVGKLFRYENGVGVTTAMLDDNGYFSDMGVRFLDFDENNCKLSKKSDLSLPQSEDWSYGISLSGRDFYCIGDTLCGVLTYKGNDAMLMYVEIDLKTGAVTSCIPFAKNDSKETKGWVYGSFLIRDNGKAVSQHNCS